MISNWLNRFFVWWEWRKTG